MWKLAFRKSCALSLLVLAVVLVGRFWYLSKDGFNVNRLRYSLPVAQSADNEDPDYIKALLDKPYHYIGRGRQCYVFASSDGRTVLKMPRFDRYALPLFWRAMPHSFMDSYRKSLYRGRQERLVFTLESFRIAADDLRDETAVVYLHLHQTQSLPARFLIYDRMNRPLEINLNQMAFALQEKKAIMMPLCLKAFREKDREAAEKMLLSFLNIIDIRAKKGIFNRDPSFLKNFGWDGEKSVQIDIGSFWRRSDLPGEEACLLSLREGTAPLRQWLAKTDPGMSEWFERQFENKIRSICHAQDGFVNFDDRIFRGGFVHGDRCLPEESRRDRMADPREKDVEQNSQNLTERGMEHPPERGR